MCRLTARRPASVSKWFVAPPRPRAGVRLFCLPYAGGSASAFRGWDEAMPSGVEVCPIQLPGRGTRFAEPLQTRLDPLVRSLAADLLPYVDRPFALFGHSMGALMAFELARVLRGAYGAEPDLLFVSAWRSPEIPDGRADYTLPNDQFVAQLRTLNGTPLEILDDPEALRLLLPIVRADFEVVQTYVYRDAPPLQCRIKAFSGIKDEGASPDLMRPWARHTAGSCSLSILPGGHFFFHEARAPLTTIVAHELAALLDREDARSMVAGREERE